MQRFIPSIALGFALLSSGAVHAGEMDASEKTIQVSIMQEPAGFEDPFFCAYVTAGENKFTFVVPQGLRLKGDADSGRILLGNLQGDRTVSFTMLNPGTAGSELNVESCRAFLLKRHPEGKILKEFSAGVLGKAGQGFDVQWKATENLYQCERIVFVPTQFGMFIFSATAARSSFLDAQSNLGLLMTTFRASTDGKFRPVHIGGTS